MTLELCQTHRKGQGLGLGITFGARFFRFGAFFLRLNLSYASWPLRMTPIVAPIAVAIVASS